MTNILFDLEMAKKFFFPSRKSLFTIKCIHQSVSLSNDNNFNALQFIHAAISDNISKQLHTNLFIVQALQPTSKSEQQCNNGPFSLLVHVVPLHHHTHQPRINRHEHLLHFPQLSTRADEKAQHHRWINAGQRNLLHLAAEEGGKADGRQIRRGVCVERRGRERKRRNRWERRGGVRGTRRAGKRGGTVSR